MKTSRIHFVINARTVPNKQNGALPSLICLQIIWLTFLLEPSNCVAQNYADSIVPPSEEIIAQLGKMGITTTNSTQEFSFPLPSTKREGAKAMALDLAWPEDGLDPNGAMFQLAWAPVGGLLGAAVGTIHGVSERKRNSSAAVLTEVAGEFQDKDRLAMQFVNIARKKADHRLALVSRQISGQDRSRLIWANASDENLRSVDPDPSKQSGEVFSVTEQGIDTVLEISVLSQRLISKGVKSGLNPPLSLEVALRVRLIRTHDGAELFAMFPRYDGGYQKFTKWAAKDGQPLRDELEHAYQELGERIVEKLSLRADGGSFAMSLPTGRRSR